VIFAVILYDDVIVAAPSTPAFVTKSSSPSSFPLHTPVATNSNRRRGRTTTTTTTTTTAMEAFWSSWWTTPTSDKTEQQGMSTLPKDTTNTGNRKKSTTKKVTFVRHGCTYMNEYLSGKDGGTRFHASDFTDIFMTLQQQQKYHDTPLSPAGRVQATTLGSLPIAPTFLQNCDLVVVSPLTRALQTFELGIKPHLDRLNGSHCNENDANDIAIQVPVPIMALPDAAERLYLISDVGRPLMELQSEFPYVDFESWRLDHVPHPPRSIHRGPTASTATSQCWWYQPPPPPPNDGSFYEEWRPIGQQQRYACPGEPYDAFNVRMSRFYYWLQSRSESNIIVVCHHGVIDWMLDISFANCQYKQLPFTSIKPRTLLRIEQMEQIQPARL
jgi:broad specificity phosphatase PhoE